MYNDTAYKLRIYTHPTYFYMSCDRYGFLTPRINIRAFLPKLTETTYNPVLKIFQIMYQYFYYNKEEGTLSFPINTLSEFLEYIGNHPYEVIDKGYVTPRDIHIGVRSKFKQRDEQVELINFLTDPDTRFKALSARTGIGKGSTHSTRIKVPGGWTTMGSIRVGDRVTCPDGSSAPIVGKYPQGIEKVWQVVFEDGRYTECDESHLWSIYTDNTHDHERRIVDTRTLQYLVSSGEHICSINTVQPECRSIEPDKDLPIHPYLMGVLLSNNMTTGSGVYIEADPEILYACTYLLPKGHTLTIRKHKVATTDNVAYIQFDEKDPPKRHIKLLLEDLGLASIKDVFIPEIYFSGSYEQRMQLLQGILDTEGNVDRDHVTYCTTSMRLRHDLVHLIWSLGGIVPALYKSHFCKYKRIRIHEKAIHILHAKMPTSCNVFTLPTKRKEWRRTCTSDDSLTLRIVNVKETLKFEECSCIYVDHIDHLYIVDDYIVTHNTTMTAFALAELGHPALILTMGLIKQWYNELLDKTHLKKNDIYVIQGNAPLRKLIDSDGYYPKVIIASIRTMSMYAAAKKIPYSDILSYPDFQKKFGIGVVAVDEVHMDFYANTLIMLRTQVKHNIFLSATYERSSPQGERIFNLIFPPKVQFGSHLVKKYTATTMLSYTFSKPLNEQAFITKDGYNHALFEAKILRDKVLREEFLRAVVNTTMDAYYLRVREPKQKCLFICYTTDMVDAIGSYLTRHYPAMGVLCFYGDQDDSSITSAIDVIVSTQRKSGTGRDIKGLRVAANTMSFKSLPLAKQMMGRVREIPGTLTYYLDFYCSALNSHQRHALKRRSRYQDLSLTFYETTV